MKESRQQDQMQRTKIRLTVGIVLLCLSINANAQKGAERGQTARVLKLGEVVEQEIAGEKIHTFLVNAARGEFLQLVVDQRGVDVVVTLYGPDGKKLKEVDSPNGTQGPESVETITETAGTHRLEVRSLEKTGSGKYVVSLKAKRTPTVEDRARLARAATLAETQELIDQAQGLGQRASYKEAVALAEKALAIREKAFGADHADVALALTTLAELYFYMGNYDQAESLFQRALTIDEKTLGPEHPDVATDLNNLALMYDKKGDHTVAEPLYQRSLAIRERVLGPEHPEVGNSLGNLGGLYYAKGDYGRAGLFFERALKIREKALGTDHPDITSDISNLAVLYQLQGNYAKAEPLLERVLAIRLKVVGESHPDTARALTNLALLYKAKGDYARAESLFLRGLAIQEKPLGSEHPDLATTLNNLAGTYYTKGDYVRAVPLYERTLSILEKALGQQHPNFAASLNNLATVYENKGDYARAETVYLRSLAIREKALGPEHSDVAVSLNNLGSLYARKGDVIRADRALQRALKINERALGREHPTVAFTLNNLAALYHGKGDYSQAESLFRRVLSIHEKALGPEHPSVLGDLNNLAVVQDAKGEYAQAEALLQRVLTIRERVLGTEHPGVATTLGNLAMVYESRGDSSRAESLHKRALAIREKALGAQHPELSISLNNLASFYKSKGEYESAESLYLRALSIRENTLGESHPDVAVVLNNLFALYYASGNKAKALQTLGRGNAIQESNLVLVLATGSERQKQLYLNTLAGKAESTISFHINSLPHNDEAARLALTAILQRKGRSLDATTDQISILRNRVDPKNQELLDQWSATRTQLATLQISRTRRLTLEARRAEAARLTSELERLEGEVSARSEEFRFQTRPVKFETVREAIPENVALVEFFLYRPFNEKAQTKAERFGADRYVAYVLRHAATAPQFVDLGDASEIDKAVSRFRSALKNPRQKDLKPASRTVDDLVMLRIRALLGKSQTMLISPDGALALIPFAALIDENGKYLIENYSIRYLTSGRDLLRISKNSANSETPLVMANPLYDLTVTNSVESGFDRATVPAPNPRSTDFRLESYPPLPGTAAEAASLKELWPDANVIVQDQATEAALKQTQRPRFLHLATHGFFLVDQQRESRLGSRALGAMSDTFAASPLPDDWENPLLRSGVVLAGVKQGQSGIGEDGVLTAMEAAALNLWGTKLVVLSACETGLGDVRNGEGVYGLRRALVLAGSETQVMSLWKVSDAGTRDLMTDYYTRLRKGEGRADALRQVQLAMLRGALKPRDPKPSRTRETKDTSGAVPRNYRHPYFWAAFIQSGDWRSLDGK